MRYATFNLIFLLAIGFSAVISLTGCSDQSDGEMLDTFFAGNKGGEKLKGDGIAFTRDSSSVLHVRLLAGSAEFHDGIDVVINYESAGSYIIPEGGGSLAEVYGLDAVGNSFSSIGLPSDIINVNWNLETGFVEGDFEFTSIDRTDDAELKVEGSFKVQVGDSNEPWDCGFLKFEPDGDYCSFIR